MWGAICCLPFLVIKSWEESLLLNVLQGIEHHSYQNDDAGEYELQVCVNAQGGQGVSEGGEDKHTRHHAGDLSDAAGEGYAAHHASCDGVHFPALPVGSGAGTEHTNAFQPRAESI